jgi:hypothetical protein
VVLAVVEVVLEVVIIRDHRAVAGVVLVFLVKDVMAQEEHLAILVMVDLVVQMVARLVAVFMAGEVAVVLQLFVVAVEA